MAKTLFKTAQNLALAVFSLRRRADLADAKTGDQATIAAEFGAFAVELLAQAPVH